MSSPPWIWDESLAEDPIWLYRPTCPDCWLKIAGDIDYHKKEECSGRP